MVKNGEKCNFVYKKLPKNLFLFEILCNFVPTFNTLILVLMETNKEKSEGVQTLEDVRKECIKAINDLIVLPEVCRHYRAFNKINKFKRWLFDFNFEGEPDESSIN